MLLNFRKFMDLSAGLTCITYIFFPLFKFIFSLLSFYIRLIRIEFYNLFYFSLYDIIAVSKKNSNIGLVFNLRSYIFVIIKLNNNNFEKKIF
jgi:hypothetical protein